MSFSVSPSPWEKTFSDSDIQFLCDLGFDFNITEPAHLCAISDRMLYVVENFNTHLLQPLATQIKRSTMLAASAEGDLALDFRRFSRELSGLETKFARQLDLMLPVPSCLYEQVKLINDGIRAGEMECEVDSSFLPGTRIRFRHDGSHVSLDDSLGKILPGIRAIYRAPTSGHDPRTLD
ncbi:MAG: hypothetical protein Q9219_000736 [cf. Caloplaca sp. 3 TL-2023]